MFACFKWVRRRSLSSKKSSLKRQSLPSPCKLPCTVLSCTHANSSRGRKQELKNPSHSFPSAARMTTVCCAVHPDPCHPRRPQPRESTRSQWKRFQRLPDPGDETRLRALVEQHRHLRSDGGSLRNRPRTLRPAAKCALGRANSQTAANRPGRSAGNDTANGTPPRPARPRRRHRAGGEIRCRRQDAGAPAHVREVVRDLRASAKEAGQKMR